MLNIHRTDHVDPRIQDFHHILPALFVLTPLDIRMRQLIDDHHLRMKIDHRLHIQFIQFFTLIEQLPPWQNRQSLQLQLRLLPPMCLDIPDLHIYPVTHQSLRLLQHSVRLPYPGAHADIDLELAPPRLTDQLQEMLHILISHSSPPPRGPVRYLIGEHSPLPAQRYPIKVVAYTGPPMHSPYPPTNAVPPRPVSPGPWPPPATGPDPARCRNRSPAPPGYLLSEPPDCVPGKYRYAPAHPSDSPDCSALYCCRRSPSHCTPPPTAGSRSTCHP